VNEHTARRLLWIVAIVFFSLWVLTFLILHLPGSYMHVFLVAAIGVGLMNLIAHYWTPPEPPPHGEGVRQAFKNPLQDDPEHG